MSNNAHDLSNRLLNALDNNYNVIDMQAVNEIISVLEKINITKELLETTRLGKHVNELRRKTSDATLARRAKVLVKRWRDLVIPSVNSPGHTGSNRSSAERQVRRLGNTPLTSPALSRQVVSPAVSSPRPPSRPAWGGYESDSQDVILVDDDPPAPPLPPVPAPILNTAHKPITPPVKRPPSPQTVSDDTKAKRDKKPKKRRGHSRAGSGIESAGGGGEPASAATAVAWTARNGTAHAQRHRNGCRTDTIDPYAAMVKRIPKAGDKKLKTTKELLEKIQSRGAKPASPASPVSPSSPDVMVIEPESLPIKVESPLRNGSVEPPPSYMPPPMLPLEDEREYHECTCGEELADDCPAARRTTVAPLHVRALHNVYLPGINGTRAPTHPHQFAVRKLTDPDKPGLFNSIVPLYKYSDYADDYCVKNMSKVPLCTHLPWTEFAPSPPELPPPPSPPPLRPYPIDLIEETEEDSNEEIIKDDSKEETNSEVTICPKVEAEMVSVPKLEPSERLKAPLLTNEDETQFRKSENVEGKLEVKMDFESEQQEHRTVERTKVDIDGRTLYKLCDSARKSIQYDYSQVASAPVVTLPEKEVEAVEVLESVLSQAEEETTRDDLGRPPRPENFTEWHECARLGELIALPYVVID